MGDRLMEFLHDVIRLLTNEECKKALEIVEDIYITVSYMDYNDWIEYSESEDYQEEVREYAEYLNNLKSK